MSSDSIKTVLDDIERKRQEQQAKHESSVQDLEKALGELRQSLKTQQEKLQPKSEQVVNAGIFSDRAEWTIPDLGSKLHELNRGDSMWSPNFSIAGLPSVQLEFFPKGREKTTYEGFCSLFLWCPGGVQLKYQLYVGNFLRAPDEDTYEGKIGHGHSNFCPLQPEVKQGSVTVGVVMLEVLRTVQVQDVLKLHTRPMRSLVEGHLEVQLNKDVATVYWKIPQISQKKAQYPKGASIWSRSFCAGGIADILLEFYPNGSAATVKEGYCAFYIRCSEGVSMVVTLFVGNSKKGPIKTTFDNLTGKGLPEFCALGPEIKKEDDSVEVGIQLQNQPNKVLSIES
mmetsp:Transcript_46756/g.111203  ORF Transcript_46756/g.111203 Transcript_46756/m.111203 type:complete len:340 (+) Transcript_46756:111-1130(+)